MRGKATDFTTGLQDKTSRVYMVASLANMLHAADVPQDVAPKVAEFAARVVLAWHDGRHFQATVMAKAAAEQLRRNFQWRRRASRREFSPEPVLDTDMLPLIEADVSDARHSKPHTHCVTCEPGEPVVTMLTVAPPPKVRDVTRSTATKAGKKPVEPATHSAGNPAASEAPKNSVTDTQFSAIPGENPETQAEKRAECLRKSATLGAAPAEKAWAVELATGFKGTIVAETIAQAIAMAKASADITSLSLRRQGDA